MKKIIPLFILAALVGCSGAEYAKYNADSMSNRVGYHDTKVKKNKYEVSFFGNGIDTKIKVKKQFLRRSAEIAKNNEKKGFCILDQMPGKVINGLSSWPYHQGTIKLTNQINKDNCFAASDILAIALPK